MAITAIKHFAPVITAVLEPGGELPENTYYSFTASFFISKYSSYHQQPYYNAAFSPVSNHIEITTTSTHRSIRLSWGYYDETSTWHDGIESNLKQIYFRWDNYSQLRPDGSLYDNINLNDPRYSTWNEHGYYPYQTMRISSDAYRNGFTGTDTLFYKYSEANLYWKEDFKYARAAYFNHPQWVNMDTMDFYGDLPRDVGSLVIVFNQSVSPGTGTGSAFASMLAALRNFPEFYQISSTKPYIGKKYRYRENNIILNGMLCSAGSIESYLKDVNITTVNGGFDAPHITYKNCELNDLSGSLVWDYFSGTYIDTIMLRKNMFTGVDKLLGASNFSIRPSSGTIVSYGNKAGLTVGETTRFDHRYVGNGRWLSDFHFNGGLLLLTLINPDTNLTYTNIDFHSETLMPDIYIEASYMNGKQCDIHSNLYNVTSDFGKARIATHKYYIDRMLSYDFDFNFFFDLTLYTEPNSEITITNSFGTETKTSDVNGEVTFTIKSYIVEYDENNSDGFIGKISFTSGSAYPFYTKTSDGGLINIKIKKEDYLDFETNTPLLKNEAIYITQFKDTKTKLSVDGELLIITDPSKGIKSNILKL